jgi:predicted PurR-regulated permease PerM
MSPSSKGISTIAVIVIVVIVAVGALGAFAYVAMPSIFSNQNSGSGSSTQVSTETTSIVGNSLTETVTISNNTEVDLTCNSCIITFNVNSGVTLTVNTVGNYNQVTVNGGSTSLSGTGNDNTFYLQNTKVLSNNLTGNGNTVQS